MSRRYKSLQLTRNLRRVFYGSAIALFISGVVWLLLHYIFISQGEFGPQTNPFEAWSLRIHGAASMLFLVVFGYILSFHAVKAWKADTNRQTGLWLISFIIFLILTGYLLYYTGNETLRNMASWFHIGCGLAWPIIILWHIKIGKTLNTTKSRPASNLEKHRKKTST